MAIHARQGSVRLILVIALVVALVAAFLAIQVLVFHAQSPAGAAHASGGQMASICSGAPIPC